MIDLTEIKVGDRVWGTADNYGFDGEVVEVRDSLHAKFKVRHNSNGKAFWMGDWEIEGIGDYPTSDKKGNL